MKKFDHICIKSFICILIICICAGLFGFNSYASSDNSETFGAEAVLISNYDENFYNISITATNNGKDFSGTLRFLYNPLYSSHQAYDVEISLPENSTKQIDIQIPKYSVDAQDNSTSIICFVNRRNKILYSREYKNFFQSVQDYLLTGILSDDYSSLSFLDMSGRKLTYYNNETPFQLVELTKDNLEENLNSLTFLVIDDYDLNYLSVDQIQAIKTWVQRGGTLIIGTDYIYNELDPGKMIERFDAGFLGFDPTMMKPETLNEYYNSYLQTNHDLSIYEEYSTISKSEGNGSVNVCMTPIKDIPSFESAASAFVYEMFDTCSTNTSSRYYYRNSDDYTFNSYSDIETFLNYIVNKNCHYYPFFYIALMLFYVILIGPVLYLILKVMKKQEFYWLIVPASAMMMTFFVFLISRGISLSSTEVISVSMTDMDTKIQMNSVILGFDSGYKEWSFKSNDKVRSVGPINYSGYINYTDKDKYKYDYHIAKEGNHTNIGAVSNSPFQNVYFSVISENIENGSLDIKLDDSSTDTYIFDDFNPTSFMTASNVSITNNTGRDFEYYAVIYDGLCAVFKKLKNGETVVLRDADMVSVDDNNQKKAMPFTYYSWNYYSHVLTPNAKDKDILSALGLSIDMLSGTNQVFVVGVVKNYPEISDDLSKEISYGCLYSTIVK